MATKLQTTRLLLAGAAALLLAGCGVKGDPQLPGDKADNYPRTYPQGAVPPDQPPENIFVNRRR